MKNNNEIFIKVNNVEFTFKDICKKQYLKTNNLLHMIEKQIGISLHDYPEIRHEILDISNFIKRLESLEREVLQFEHKK